MRKIKYCCDCAHRKSIWRNRKWPKVLQFWPESYPAADSFLFADHRWTWSSWVSIGKVVGSCTQTKYLEKQAKFFQHSQLRCRGNILRYKCWFDILNCHFTKDIVIMSVMYQLVVMKNFGIQKTLKLLKSWCHIHGDFRAMLGTSVTRLVDLLQFGQLLIACGNN